MCKIEDIDKNIIEKMSQSISIMSKNNTYMYKVYWMKYAFRCIDEYKDALYDYCDAIAKYSEEIVKNVINDDSNYIMLNKLDEYKKIHTLSKLSIEDANCILKKNHAAILKLNELYDEAKMIDIIEKL